MDGCSYAVVINCFAILDVEIFETIEEARDLLDRCHRRGQEAAIYKLVEG